MTSTVIFAVQSQPFGPSDDEIATQVNVKGLLSLYPNAQTDQIELKPQAYGHKAIGHMAMFKRSHQNIWPEIAAQLSS